MRIAIREYDEDPTLHNKSSSSWSTSDYAIEHTIDLDSSPHSVLCTGTSKLGQPYRALFLRPKLVLKQLFLPIGYPHSVDPSYIWYQFYDSLQGLCSYLRSVVSTSAVLQAAGVGNAKAHAMSAAMAWALRDGIGMMGGLLFSYVASDTFDSHVKEFRLFADVINDVGLTLDMTAPYYPSTTSIYILSLATVCKTMCGISAGATKGRITQHFSKHGNMADLTAKESTQETLVSLLGMIFGIGLAHVLQGLSANYQEPTTWIIFIFLTWLHVWANYRGVVLLKLTTLNPARTMVALNQVVSCVLQDDDAIKSESLKRILETMPSPEQVAESLWSSTWNLLFPQISLGGRFEPKDYDMISVFTSERYVIGKKRRSRHNLVVSLRVGATLQDEFEAFLHAILISQSITRYQKVWGHELIRRYVQRKAYAICI